ncbi:uncharacterized protein [Lepeophtheirus salmonis]|uniref:uncharacterized protein n=1 Tax=Lepeophtheirus salmonis TaxID=72036 RepID=UPI003AF3B8E0
MEKTIAFYSLSLILGMQTLLSAGQSCSTTDGRICIFPFKYLGIPYDGCTTIDYGNTAWCATSLDLTTSETVEYGACTSSCKMVLSVSTSECKSTSGATCKFPFGYKGEMYDQCTNVDFGNTFWCALSLNKNGDVRGYGICSSDCPRYSNISKNKYANKSGVACIFPYKYNGKTYEAYTTAGNSGFPWCATSLNVPEGYQGYGICKTNSPVDDSQTPSPPTTTPTTTKSVIIALKKSGRKTNILKTPTTTTIKTTTTTSTTTTTTTKTTAPSNPITLSIGGKHTNNATATIITTTPTTAKVFCCPTTNGKTCTFPFSWEGVNFDGCTNASNNGVQWCGVTIGSPDNNVKENMDCSSSCRVAATASNSGCLSTQGLPHILPFIYKGVIYSKCTDQDLGSTFWCATSVNTAGNYLSFSTCSRSCPMETTIPSTRKIQFKSICVL